MVFNPSITSSKAQCNQVLNKSSKSLLSMPSNAVLSRKRRRPEQPELSHPSPSPKRRKTKHPSASRPPPEFWDNLSKVLLTRRALIEFDRRNNQPSLRSRPVTRSAVGQWREDSNNWHQIKHIAAAIKSPSRSSLKNIRAFAKQGGPDLSDLRGVCISEIGCGKDVLIDQIYSIQIPKIL